MTDSVFPKINFHHYPKPTRGKQELLARAIGLGKGISRVLDLSCGLAQDAYFLAQLGLPVMAIERNAEIFHWISKAFELAKSEDPKNEALARMQIQQGNAIEVLSLATFQNWMTRETAIYFDPMFPQKRKSALPRKEMQLFQKLVGADEDSVDVLKACLETKVGRVIVKRPIKAPVLLDLVQHQFRGSSVRYDLYRTLILD